MFLTAAPCRIHLVEIIKIFIGMRLHKSWTVFLSTPSKKEDLVTDISVCVFQSATEKWRFIERNIAVVAFNIKSVFETCFILGHQSPCFPSLILTLILSFFWNIIVMVCWWYMRHFYDVKFLKHTSFDGFVGKWYLVNNTILVRDFKVWFHMIQRIPATTTHPYLFLTCNTFYY